MNLNMILISIVSIDTIPILSLTIFGEVSMINLIVARDDLIGNKVTITIVQVDDIV
jgi:hypothetical protein